MDPSEPPENLESVDETLPRADVVAPPKSLRPTLRTADARPDPLTEKRPPNGDEPPDEVLSASLTGGDPPTQAGFVAESPDPATLGETMAPPPSRPPASRPSAGSQRLTRPDPDFRPMAPEAAPSSAVPGYEILGVLGQGGMGIVYKARHLALDRVVALKMILRGALADRDAVERFRVEAQAVARLRHPNIVQIYEVGEHAGQPYFSLEYLEGGSLQQKLEGAPQAPQDAALLMELLARAVHHAHQQHLVHRDLKPANVLLTADGTPKITDFGLAKRIEEQDQSHTAAQAVLGTPTYMAPEQASGKTRHVGPAADIYSLGAILYDLLTGRPPLRGTTVMDTLQLVQTVDPVPPRRLQPKVPPDLQTICLKCLEKDPRRRYPSGEALADDLRRFLDGRPIEARPVSAPERAWKWARRRPAEALLLLACVLGVAGLVAGLSVVAVQQGRLAKDAEDREKLAQDLARTAEAGRVQEEKSRVALEEKQQGIIEARKLAESQRDLARQNLVQARRAIRKLLEVSQNGIPNEPHLEGLRERILESARDIAENLLDQQGDDPDVRWQAAQTMRLVGDMQDSLNRLDDAAASYDKAAGLYERLLKEKDAPAVWTEEAAQNYMQLWVVLMAQDRVSDAGEKLDQAEKLLAPLAKEHPEDADCQQDLALCRNNRGVHFMLNGDKAQAERSFQEALGLFERLPPEEKGKPAAQLEWAKAEKNLGVLYHQTNQTRKAEALYRDALKLVTPLARAEPGVPAYQKEFGPIYINLGALLTGAGPDRYADAQAVYEEAIDVCAQLGEKFSGVADYRHLLAEAYDGRGELYRRRGEADKARADLERARDELEQLPNRSEYRVDEARVLNRLATVQSKADPEAARRSWERALALCEGLTQGDRVAADARAEFYRAARNLIAGYNGEAQKALNAKDWSGAAKAIGELVGLRRKRLAVFASSPEARAGEASAAAIGPLAAPLAALVHEQERAELAATLLAQARAAEQAGAYGDAGDALDALAAPGPEAPRHWANYPEAAAVAAHLAGAAPADQREAFLGRSLALLRRAAAEGVAVPARLFDSPAFDPLRDSPEFQQLRIKLTAPR